MNHKLVLQEIEHQVTLALCNLELIDLSSDDEALELSKAQLAGVVEGIRIVADHTPVNKPFPKPQARAQQ